MVHGTWYKERADLGLVRSGYPAGAYAEMRAYALLVIIYKQSFFNFLHGTGYMVQGTWYMGT
jgi:hypothetical protein